jgi:hypothetical protein
MLGTASFAVILCKFNDIAIPDLPISFFGTSSLLARAAFMTTGTRFPIRS